mgnify:CR=1 FL=1
MAETTIIQSRLENLKIVCTKYPKNNTINTIITCDNSIPKANSNNSTNLLSVSPKSI